MYFNGQDSKNRRVLEKTCDICDLFGGEKEATNEGFLQRFVDL